MRINSSENSFLPTLDPDRAGEALYAIDEIARLYMDGIRKIERRILAVPDQAGRGPQENVAEHSHSVWLAVKTLWENRSDLGITFGDNFDIGLSLAAAQVHDIGETASKNGDIDAMSEDVSALSNKSEDEINAFKEIAANNKYLGWLAEVGIKAEKKDEPEFKFSSDVDKHTGTRIITLYSPYHWWGFGGAIATREKHSRVMRAKLITPFGHTLYDAIENDFDKREALAEERKTMPLFPPTVWHGEALCASFTHKMYMGYRKWPKETQPS
jgi:hypothetical protein